MRKTSLTKQQMDFLRDYGNRLTTNEICDSLHTSYALARHALVSLGIVPVKRKQKVWTKTETAYIKLNKEKSIKSLCHKLKRNPGSIKRKIYRVQEKKPSQKLKVEKQITNWLRGNELDSIKADLESKQIQYTIREKNGKQAIYVMAKKT